MGHSLLLSKMHFLIEEINRIKAERVLLPEQEQQAKSELYHWSREQMALIHQMKYQFSQDVTALQHERAKMNQEARSKLEEARQNVMV